MLRHNKKLIIVFLSIVFSLGIALYILFLVGDFTNISPYPNKRAIKYGAVILAFVTSLISFLFLEKKKDDILDLSFLTTGLLITLVADFFLVVLDEYYEVAVGVFIFAQIAYFIREIFSFKYHQKEIIIYCSIRVGLTIILLIVLTIIGQCTLLNALAAVYIVELLMNFVGSLVYFIRQKRIDTLLLSIGFLFFIVCDVCVAINNMGSNDFFKVAWIFYVPSQLLIASSYMFSKLFKKDN